MSLIESSVVTTVADIGSELPTGSLGKNEVGYPLSGDNTLCEVVKSDVMREGALITTPLVNNNPLGKLGLQESPLMSVQDVTDRLEDLKHEPSTVHPTPSRNVAVMSSLTDLSLKWADLVEVGNDARVKGVQDSLVMARARGFSRSTDATNVDIASSSDGGGLGISDSADCPSIIGDCLAGAIPNRGPVIEREQTPLEGNRGGMQGRRGGANPSFRGGRGGRGNVWVNRSQNVTGARSWANVASTPVHSEVKLHFVQPSFSSDSILIDLPVPSVFPIWESCLVGYFIDRSLSFTCIKNNAFNMWKNLGLEEVRMNEEGFIFFIFDHIDSCKKVIDGGPWYVGGILLILKQWHRMMKLTKEALTEIPVWVKFYNVPMEFWSTDGLSRIASAIGVPRFMDQLTSFGTRVSFARVCVDIKAESPLPDSFFIQCEGIKVEIRVEYQGVSVSCSHCGVFGHETKACVSAQVSHLIELQKATETNLGEDEGWKTMKDKGKRKAGENLTPVVATQSEVNEN
ncbi:hypothetical protein ACSBR1_032168 [Camellia fascicularis]